MPSKARSARKLEADLMNAVYMIHGGLLYRYMRNPTGESDPVLCVPASKIDIFLELFHSSILGGHMGMSKCVLTLQQKFYCPNLAYHVRMYIISCHVCQTFKNHKRFDRTHEQKNYRHKCPYPHTHFYGYKAYAPFQGQISLHTCNFM